MDSVLEGAVVLCACKLACNLFFLPLLATSRSPISFCCCCLLVFTDFLITVFLGSLCIWECWLTQLTPHGDIIALRFLVFLSHTYGVVLLLTVPLIAVEILTRLLRTHRTSSQTAGSDGQWWYVEEVTVEEEEDEEDEEADKDRSLSRVVSYLCCLSVWVAVAFNVRWRWSLEEAWAVDCLHKTNSLVKCLPNLFSRMSNTMNPWWDMAFISLLLLFLTTSAGLHRRAPARTAHGEKHGVDNSGEPVNAAMSVSEATQRVDPEKTQSSCTVHSAQMSACRHGDFVLNPPECLSAERGGQEHERTKRGIPPTFITEDHMDPQYGSQCGWRRRGFPCLELNVMIGFVGVLSIFVLPLNLSVNILLIRTIEILLELCIKSLLSTAASVSSTEMLV